MLHEGGGGGGGEGDTETAADIFSKVHMTCSGQKPHNKAHIKSSKTKHSQFILIQWNYKLKWSIFYIF